MRLLALEEDGVAVSVGGHRNAELGHGLAHDDEVALGIFRGLQSPAPNGDAGREPRVLVASQLDDVRRDCSVDRVVSRSASIAVNQAGRSFFALGLPQAPQLPLGDSQQLACLSVDQRSRLQVVENDDSALLSSIHDDPAIHGVTESLFASGVTDSLYFHKKSGFDRC